MSGSTFGKIVTLTTAGESHGPSMTAIFDGCPAGMLLCESDIQPYLDRRRPGASRYTSQRREEDRIILTSGIFEGRTTGAPIAFNIANCDAKASDYEALANVFRPGHADYTYHHKYGIRDHRGGGRASARDTASWVAAGAIAQKYLREQHNIHIAAALTQIGEILCAADTWQDLPDNSFFCADANRVASIANYIDAIRREGDSIGGAITVRASGVPVGLGEPVFSKLDAAIAHAMMSINAVKAVAIGDGFAVCSQRGSQHRDEITPSGFISNHAGGILGGISSGQDIIVSLAVKPTSSIVLPARTIDSNGHATTVSTTGRHDPCIAIRAVPVAQAMLALVIMDYLLQLRSYR